MARGKAATLKSLQVIDSLGMGGAETWLMEVLRLWARSGEVEMDFLLTSGRKELFDEEAKGLGASLHYLSFGKRGALRFRKEFVALLERQKYDVIHDHQDFASGWHFLLGAGRLPPIRITHVHNPSYQIENNYGVTASRRVTSKVGKELVRNYATFVAGTSRQMLHEYGFEEERFARIPKAAVHCGFDPGRFGGDRTKAVVGVREELNWPAETRIVLFAGRMDQSPDVGHPQNHKNSAFAVDVVNEVLRKDGSVRVLFVGKESPAKEVLERRVETAGFRERVGFLGLRQDIERLMLASDVLLFPSRGEGLGMVAVEAQAAGLPVLASDAVPSECVVVPDLVKFLPLTQSIERWASEALRLSLEPRDVEAGNRAVRESPFALANSADRLRELYEVGRLN